MTVEVTHPTTNSAVILVAATSSGSGSAFVTFSSAACRQLDVVNNTGTTIEYQRNGAGNWLAIPTGSHRLVIGISNANQIGVRRTDLSTTSVSVTAEAYTL